MCETLNITKYLTIKMNKKQLWIQKYKPTSLESITTHKHIINTLNNMWKNGSITNVICYGTPGCGKTTVMEAFGKDMYKETVKFNLMKINASDERGISMIRSKITQFIQSKSLFTINDKNVPDKMVILDEADYMTSDAQFAISNLMDDYPEVMFVFICNYIYKIHDLIQSRCITLYFCSIPIDNIKDIVLNIKRKENIDITNDAINTLCKLTNNDLRSVMYMLQSLHCSKKHLTPSNIYVYNQYPTNFHIKTMLEKIKEGMLPCFEYISDVIKDVGITINHIIIRLYETIMENENIPDEKRDKFILHFAELENNLTFETSIDISIGHLVSGLWLVKDY